MRKFLSAKDLLKICSNMHPELVAYKLDTQKVHAWLFLRTRVCPKIHLVTDCKIWLLQGRGFINNPLSMTEWNFCFESYILQSFSTG